jgi:hypothetical protein
MQKKDLQTLAAQRKPFVSGYQPHNHSKIAITVEELDPLPLRLVGAYMHIDLMEGISDRVFLQPEGITW